VADCKVDEVADGIYRNSTYLPDVVAAQGLTINPFLVLADEPLLVHTGLRTTFPETVAQSPGSSPLSGCGGCRSGTWRPTSAGR
jgi:hypothetical protein